MTTKTITVLEGLVGTDVFGRYSDCSPGVYVGSDKVDSAVDKYHRQYVRVTIEPIEEPDYD